MHRKLASYKSIVFEEKHPNVHVRNESQVEASKQQRKLTLKRHWMYANSNRYDETVV